ncbi:MAG TPA: amidohydrolase family protein, partial [Candidatus Acidoferrales bacterium]
MPPSLTADLVIRNAKVWTVDPALPSAEAVAIAAGRIVAVGGNSGVQEWAGPKTRVVDAAGASVLPGFNDAHVHFVTGGFHLQQVDLRDAATPEEFSRRV